MGNRRKILAAVFGVLLLAVGTVSGALFAFKPRTVADTPVANAATTVSNGGSATINGTKCAGSESASFSVSKDRVYLVEIAGQSGAYYDDSRATPGKGYIIRGYCKATGSSASGTIGAGVNANDSGGGYTSFPINFGRPNGYTGVTTGYAGGGGGVGFGCSVYSANQEYWANGGNAGFSSGDRGGSNVCGYGGYGGTQSKAGTGGSARTPTTGSVLSVAGRNGTGSNGASGATCSNAETSESGIGGDGGGGYYGGGGGAAFGSYGHYGYCGGGGGGGGSCSPNTYAVGLNNTNDYGYITVYDVTPTKNPAGSTVSYPNTATITDGSVGNSSVGSRQWQYSTDNATWSTTKPTQTAIGTKKVYWRYVITETNVASTECVIASGSVDLTVTKADGTVSAPTLTGNGSATYSGNDIQVVTAAGQSSGTFTFATVKTKDEE